MIVIFCVPGEQFSSRFLTSWTDLIVNARRKGIEVYLRNKYTSNVYLCRNLILRQDDCTKGSSQKIKPFPNIPYDYLMWIDDDMVFRPEDFYALLKREKDIISGVAITNPLTSRLNFGHIGQKGEAEFCFQKDLPDLPRENGLIEADFCGFAWILIKKGVFESLPFPWFRPLLVNTAEGYHFPSEDLSWCALAKQYGYKIWIDPDVKIGHEKIAVLRVREEHEHMEVDY